MSEPTVSDAELFDTLPLSTREAIERLYGGSPMSFDGRIAEAASDARVEGFEAGEDAGYRRGEREERARLFELYPDVAAKERERMKP